MLDRILGPRPDPEAFDLLLSQLRPLSLTGTLYSGYPLVLIDGETHAIDAFLISREHGVVVFDFLRGARQALPEVIAVRIQKTRRAVAEALERSGRLTVGGKLIVDPRVVILDPEHHSTPPAALPKPAQGAPAPPVRAPAHRYSLRAAHPTSPAARQDESYTRGAAPVLVTEWNSLAESITQLPRIDAATFRFVEAAVDRLGNSRMQGAAPAIGQLAGSRSAVLAEIDTQIASLDRWQKAAAIEMPEGPQRIRGLAGSGKTVVLAWKAAFLHATNPHWRILLTYYGRSLFEPLRDMVGRYYREHTGRDPDWGCLAIKHAWGAQQRTGVYTEIAEHVGIPALTPNEAKERFHRHRIFEGVCKEVINAMGRRDPASLYDVVLVDEAQDVPPAFLEMIYRVTAPPKRVVWAYDDLQNVGAYRQPPSAQLFGNDPRTGKPRVPLLPDDEGKGRTDIVLPVCYRNTRWGLTTAHALGMGIYRQPTGHDPGVGLVQFNRDPQVWRNLGYEVDGDLSVPGSTVRLSRGAANTPGYFNDLLDPADAVYAQAFETEMDEADWVADQIAYETGTMGLSLRDVLIVSVNPFLKRDATRILDQALNRRGLRLHMAGSDGHIDGLFGEPDTVSIAIVQRAKGHEAAMVYVVHAEEAVGSDRVRRRNTIFTAITRSRAWVRITGSGPGARIIKKEIDAVAQHGYELVLRVPAEPQFCDIDTVHRDHPQDRT